MRTTLFALLLAGSAGAVEINELATDQPMGWTGSTQILPNGDGGLIVEQNDGTNVLTLSANGQMSVSDRISTNFHIAGNSSLHANFGVNIGGSGHYLGFNGTGWSTTPDTRLYRDAANSLALRNDGNAQRFNVYNTHTDASNYERLGVYWSGNVATISTEAAGTGTSRALRLQAGSQAITLDVSGAISTSSNTWTQGSRFSLSGSSNVAYFQTASLTDYASVRMAATQLVERSADPSDPSEGQSAIWQSDGTGSGDDGDIMVKITAGGVTKTITLIDFSSF